MANTLVRIQEELFVNVHNAGLSEKAYKLARKNARFVFLDKTGIHFGPHSQLIVTDYRHSMLARPRRTRLLGVHSCSCKCGCCNHLPSSFCASLSRLEGDIVSSRSLQISLNPAIVRQNDCRLLPEFEDRVGRNSVRSDRVGYMPS